MLKSQRLSQLFDCIFRSREQNFVTSMKSHGSCLACTNTQQRFVSYIHNIVTYYVNEKTFWLQIYSKNGREEPQIWFRNCINKSCIVSIFWLSWTMVRCWEEDSEVPISLIKSLSLACESTSASSSKVNVCSEVLCDSSFMVRFGNGESPLLPTLPSLLYFSEEKILSMPSLPANHHTVIRKLWNKDKPRFCFV